MGGSHDDVGKLRCRRCFFGRPGQTGCKDEFWRWRRFNAPDVEASALSTAAHQQHEREHQNEQPCAGTSGGLADFRPANFLGTIDQHDNRVGLGCCVVQATFVECGRAASKSTSGF